MILHIDVQGEIHIPAMNLLNRDRAVSVMTSPQVALCEVMLKSCLSGFWFVNGNTMNKVDRPGDLQEVTSFVLNLQEFDFESMLLVLGTVEGYYRSGISARGFKWELVLSGARCAIVIGYNEAKKRRKLPVKVCSLKTSPGESYCFQEAELRRIVA